MNKVKKYREKINSLLAKREAIKEDIDKAFEKRIKLKKELQDKEKALVIIQTVALDTQKQLQYHVSDITTLAMEAVFENPYSIELDFLERRNKTECDIYFSRNGERCRPVDSSGGGVVDVASFALRIASWSLQKKKTRSVMFLDEPTKFVSEEYREKVSAMIKEISEKLNIQFIIVTHDPKLTSYADKVFSTHFNKRTGTTKIKAEG